LTKLFIWIFQLNANALNYSNFIHKCVEDRINWDYFAKQTAGLSAAHISAAMNSSLLKVISENYFSDYWKPAKKKSRTNTFQFVPLIQDRIKKLVFRNSKH
jgi:hypothetical protein